MDEKEFAEKMAQYEEQNRELVKERERLSLIVKTKLHRNMLFYKRVAYLFITVFVVFVVGIGVMILNMVCDWGLDEAIDTFNTVTRYFAMSSGFIMAEMVRRSTVNEDTEDLRCYTWRELMRRGSYVGRKN